MISLRTTLKRNDGDDRRPCYPCNPEVKVGDEEKRERENVVRFRRKVPNSCMFQIQICVAWYLSIFCCCGSSIPKRDSL